MPHNIQEELIPKLRESIQSKVGSSPEEWAKYISPRGYLAVNGCSLTVAEVEDNLFTINLIPETLRQTTFSRYRPGDRLNIEVDHQTMVLVDVIERTVSRVLPGLIAGR